MPLNNLYSQINPALYSTITNIFLLIIFMKFVRLI
ncbi:DUF3688 domain-containing protein [Spiroplasma citri]|uniref:DUF3688 domain-containing protein n=1 Tax=Spiroplasma citri TaxID=2133 RepID=A0AAJ4EL38_SPICI|nr:DUF3688 domain-containing protein [Spiroplasma citri]QIA67939.1 DUF3688 domain-containing protein [Spiroplasma citri]QIA69798.1 DUF3688 domain-containing protein [Spiroplasma citri]QIA71674.1 DUF3688 domain-containing protein [Spiroplasma citri]QIA73783.1 DUF3688 domain-containing protein [Spiroplasma citri]